VRLKKSVYLVLITVLVLSLALVGCGKKDQETVMKDLSNFKEDLKSYESKATMTVSANNSQQKYYIETWYLAPNYYRIALGNDPKDITQVIVKNDDGIFVVSPSLKKSFRFKGDWAENQGHVYLYHAAVDRILKSQNLDYDAAEGKLSFTLKMEPENPLVSTQRITLNESNLYPQQIALLDKNEKSLVSVDFDSFTPGVEYKKENFTPEAAMALAPTDAQPVMAGAKDFGIIEPRYLPEGVTMLKPQETQSSVLLRFQGSEPFTIIEHRPAAKDTALRQGEIVDLWGVPAVVSEVDGGETRSLHWFHNNVEFSLTGKLPVDEMVRVAQSMIGTVGK
jgi:outer membrane lipoprotein-sorting protein